MSTGPTAVAHWFTSPVAAFGRGCVKTHYDVSILIVSVISMKRFIEGENRFQSTLFPERLDDYIAGDILKNAEFKLNKNPLAMRRPKALVEHPA